MPLLPPYPFLLSFFLSLKIACNFLARIEVYKKLSQTGELNASQVCFDNFSKKLGLSNIKITGEAASADQEAIAKSQTPLRKSLTRQNICLNKFLMQMKLPYSGKIATKDIYQ